MLDLNWSWKGRNWSGIVPNAPETFLGHARPKTCFWKTSQQHKTSTCLKTDFVGTRHLKKWTSYGTSGRSAKGKMTVHWSSFYKLGGMGVLSLTISSNLHDFHGKMGVIFFNKKQWAQMGPLGPGPNEWAQWARAQGPNEWAQQGPNESPRMGPNGPGPRAQMNGPNKAQMSK